MFQVVCVETVLVVIMGKKVNFPSLSFSKIRSKVGEIKLPFGVGVKSFSYLLLCGFLLISSFFLLLINLGEDDLLTGRVSQSQLDVDSSPVITINDSVFYVNQLINLTPCGYDQRGGEIVCTFSPPFDFFLGNWTPSWGDIGEYNVQINATNDWGELSIKNVTIQISSSIIEGECELYFNVDEHHRILVSWDTLLKKNDFEYHDYDNFTLSYVDYLVNGTFNETDAINVTNINVNFYFDTTANETKERYYKLFAHHDGKTFSCNETYGKITRNITMEYGRWNYISSPFLRRDKSLNEFIGEADSDLEVVFMYNHDTGGFNFYLFDINFGDIDEVDYSECLIIQPTEQTRITTAGKIMKNISVNLTTSFDRWNYMGWISEYTNVQKAFSGYEDDLEVIFVYDHDSGGFRFRLFDISFGTIDDIQPSHCNIIQPFNNVLYEYEIG